MTLAILFLFAIFAILFELGRQGRREALDTGVGYGPVHIRSKWADQAELYLPAGGKFHVQPLALSTLVPVSPAGAWQAFRHVGREWSFGRALKMGLGVLYASQLARMEQALRPLARAGCQDLHIRLRAFLRADPMCFPEPEKALHEEPGASIPF